MKNKIISIVIISIFALLITGCTKQEVKENNKKQKEELELKEAYFIDSNKTNNITIGNYKTLVIVADLTPKQDIKIHNYNTLKKVIDEVYFLSNEDKKINVHTTVTNKAHKATKIEELYVRNNNEVEQIEIKANETKEVLIGFYTSTSNFNTDEIEIFYELPLDLENSEEKYKVSQKLKISDIKEINSYEEIKENKDYLMEESLKWKLNELIKIGNSYEGKGFTYEGKFACYGYNQDNKSKYLKDFVKDKTKSNYSITNTEGILSNLFNKGEETKYIKYTNPELDYKKLNKKYPGIKSKLTTLNNDLNKYSEGLSNLKEGECFTDFEFNKISSEAEDIYNLMK